MADQDQISNPSVKTTGSADISRFLGFWPYRRSIRVDSFDRNCSIATTRIPWPRI